MVGADGPIITEEFDLQLLKALTEMRKGALRGVRAQGLVARRLPHGEARQGLVAEREWLLDAKELPEILAGPRLIAG